MRHSEADAEESSAEKRFWILHCVQDDEDAVLYSTQGDEDAIQEITGSFTTFRMTRAKKKETQLSPSLFFCGCQDSNLERYENRTSLHCHNKVRARPLATTTG